MRNILLYVLDILYFSLLVIYGESLSIIFLISLTSALQSFSTISISEPQASQITILSTASENLLFNPHAVHLHVSNSIYVPPLIYHYNILPSAKMVISLYSIAKSYTASLLRRLYPDKAPS